MANANQTAAPVLPLPPLEYDVQWANMLIRLLNFWIQQTQNPGAIRGTTITITDREGKVAFSVDSSALVDENIFIIAELPTAPTGLAANQLWLNGSLLSLAPGNIPTSATGLVSGQIWADPANSYVLKVIP